MAEKSQGSVMVVGAGIAGIQASLDLADSGYLVYLVDKNTAIGGTMAQLDKTFPTNDCSMCIISPKLVEAGRHLNIELKTMSEIIDVSGEEGDFTVTLKEEPRYIDMDKCTACGECAKVCPVDVPNAFDERLRDRKAIFKLYPQGMPSAYSIDKRSTAPCKATCPAHVSIQGFIALMQQGKYAEALKLFKEEHPFPGSCGRVCHHPCESACTRGDADQALAIQYLHRFLADQDFAGDEPYVPEIEGKKDEKIAIVGSGPAGLTAAYYMARKGYGVTVFEKLPVKGGMMAVGIPEYRLPKAELDREIEVIEKLGVEIRTGVSFGEDITLASLKADGYAAAFLATGLHGSRSLGVKGEDLDGVLKGVTFLREAALGTAEKLSGKVMVIGGGNVAVDVALTARRLGADEVKMVCLEKRDEMPAWDYEIEEALEEGVVIVNSLGPLRFVGENGRVSEVEFQECTQVFDREGRFNPQYDDCKLTMYDADTVIVAIGQAGENEFAKPQGIELSAPGGLSADPVTLQTPIDWVFAGGDAVYGPKSVVDAIASGKDAAISMDRFIQGEDLAFDRINNWEYEKPEILDFQEAERVQPVITSVKDREGNFNEVTLALTQELVEQEVQRCLSCGICSECYQCVDACLAGAVNHFMVGAENKIHVGAIIMAPGFQPFDPSKMVQYCYGHSPNVLTSLEFERVLSASGPYEGHLVRPSDHKEPDKIAWLQCVGSRDINKGDHSYCSSVCCMYANKQAVIAKEHSERDLDTAIFFMDMRTHGKEFDKYNIRAQDNSGVRFVRSRIHSVFPEPGDRYRIVYSSEAGNTVEEIFDMVVLSIGLAPNKDAALFGEKLGIEMNHHGFAETRNLAPVSTNRKGIYVCGAFQEPKDIPSSVMEASAAAASASMALKDSRWTQTRKKELPDEIDFSGQIPKIGVFVCNCGINIGGIADVPAVRDYAKNLPYVVHVEDNLFTCSQDTQDKMKEVILEKGLNRVVVASCSTRTHEPLFQETIREAGLNKYLFEMANIRDQNTWVHMNQPEKATEKAKDLVRMAVAKAALVEPLHQVSLEIKKTILIIGGGVAGMEAALSAAEQGVDVHLVEKADRLGGIAWKLNQTWKGEPIREYLTQLIEKVTSHELITVYMHAEVETFTGSMGNFISTISVGSGDVVTIEYGAAILSTGGKEYKPHEYLYGENPDVLTHLEMDALVREKDERLQKAKSVVFIQCVGSRNEENPYCSKICCTHSLKSALGLKKMDPRKRVYIVYRDIRSYGFREDLYKEAREKGVLFIRYGLEEMPSLKKNSNDQLELTAMDHVLRVPIQINPDLVVLATGVRPADNSQLFEKFKVPVNDEGFLVEAHAKLRPVDFASEGLFVAGLAHYPKPMEESIAQGKAAVSRAMTILARDSLMVGGVVAEVTPEKCAVCLTCVRACPYGIPVIHENGYAEINPVECHGCGVCVSECPGKAIQLNHFTDPQILAKVDAFFEQV